VSVRILAAATLALALAGAATAADAPVPGARTPAPRTWRDEYRAALEAHAAHDAAGFRAHLDAVGVILGPSAGLSFQLARAEALAGHRDAALAHLADYAASGMVRGVTTDSDFVALSADTAFRAVVARIGANGSSAAGDTVALHRFASPALLVEDVAWDPARHTFDVACVRAGGVRAVGERGGEDTLVARAPHGWGAFAVRPDPAHHRLWMCVAATPTSDGYTVSDSGRTALLAWDLASAREVKRLEPPRDRARVLGDMTLGPDGTVYVSDGIAGGVFRCGPKGDSLERLVPDGVLESPQTPALAADGRRLYVPEYGRGIAIVDLKTKEVTRVQGGADLFLSTIDGLYRDGDALIAVQNGANPERIVRFTLDPTGTRVTGWRRLAQGTPGFGDPTHGCIVGRDFVYIANSGWDRVGNDQRLRDDPRARPAELRTVPLDH
jgi:hypothetical protein